jgi:hypothetical protein
MRVVLSLLIATLAWVNIGLAQESDCRKCVRDKLQTAKAKAVAGTALGAMGGATGLLPGAVCGAILGLTTAGVDSLIELSECESTCKAEAQKRHDPQAKKCDDLMAKVKK